MLMRAADHVEHRLPFFLFDDFERALERRQKLLWIVDHFAVAFVGATIFITRPDAFITAADALPVPTMT